MTETTLVLLKPDAVRRHLVGRIIARLEDKGLSITGARLLIMSWELAEEHYREHAGRPFFPELLTFITSGPLLALAISGSEAVRAVRSLVGETDPLQAAPGTIRGDFGLRKSENVVHASDCPASAERELALFFKSEDIFTHKEPSLNPQVDS